MAADILNAPHFKDADKAREFSKGHYALNGKTTRPGLYKCKDCREPFTVTVGTVFERSHIPLNVWLKATHLLCASKKGMSSLQLKRMLGGPGSSGVVEVDETYWGRTHKIRG